MSISVSVVMLQIHYSMMTYFADMRSQQYFGKSYLCTYNLCKAMYLTTNYYILCRRMVIYYLFFFTSWLNLFILLQENEPKLKYAAGVSKEIITM